MTTDTNLQANISQTFRTNNRQLAFALILAGCSLAPQGELNGPAVNLYTLGFLREISSVKGMAIEDAVRWCMEKKLPGNVTYVFLREDNLERAVAAWDAMVQAWMNADASGQPHPIPEIETKTVMDVLFVYFNSLEKLSELPWFNTPMISDQHTTTRTVPIPGKPGNRTIIEGTFKQWSLGASVATKTRLGII